MYVTFSAYIEQLNLFNEYLNVPYKVANNYPIDDSCK